MRHQFFALSLFGGLAALSTTAQAGYLDNPDVRDYIDEISTGHAIARARLESYFAAIDRQDSVIEKISRPAEKRLEWKDYRPIFLKEDRITQGVAFMREYAAPLSAAELRWGVPAEIITAIIGVETKYGRITGSHPVFSSVATLAFDYPPRAKFFRSELTEYLLFAEEEGFDPLSLKGSYAGAMGMPQFISSSYRRYAVDFDGDGKRDLFNSVADAIGSVANYFAEHGWTKGEAVTERLRVPADQYKPLLRKGLKPQISRTALAEKGISLSGKSQGDLLIYTLQGDQGEEAWAGHNNFYVITRYNHSPLYAMAVFELSEKIRQRREAE
ncbi:lytic murein transglycosylase B [Granulosicoccaceae sp. 1_MG-2023]|nr:lytic murein transglycosylase B [Granulosicoccaceae sp. 1_MG-2023]